MEVVGAAFAVQAAKPGRPVGLLEVRRSDRAACVGQVSVWQLRVLGEQSARFGVGRTEAERAAVAGQGCELSGRKDGGGGGALTGSAGACGSHDGCSQRCGSPSVWQLKL